MNERKIEFEGIRNCRDLGSLVNREGKTIRKGKLIRSANLSNATDKDLIKLEDMNLKKVVDLRSVREVRFSPDRYPENTEYVHNYIFAENRDGISHEKCHLCFQRKYNYERIPCFQDICQEKILLL